MTFFLNYLRSDQRATCLNLAIARLVLCTYGIWKVASYPYVAAVSFPVDFLAWDAGKVLGAFRWASPHWMALEQGVTIVLLVSCALGFARAFSSFTAAFLITHMSGLAFAAENEKSILNLTFFLIFYGIFRRADLISLDVYLGYRKSTSAELKSVLQKPRESRPVRLEALKWFLVTLALIYFFTGFSKWQAGGWTLAWGSWENIRLAILNNAVGRTLAISPVGEFLAGQPLLLSIAGYGTLFLELGFLPAVLLGLPITPFIVCLAGMHAVILLAMDVNYLADMVFFYAAFFAWDSLAARMQARRNLMVVFDDKCPFCMRTLLMFRMCDVSGGLRFVGSSDPEAPSGHGYANEMFVFDEGGRVHAGYAGFVALFSYLGLARPLAWIMAIPPVAFLGRKFYKLAARTRSCESGIRHTPNHQAKS